MRHAWRARVRARHQSVGGDGGLSLLMKHMHRKRVSFSNFARAMHGNSFSANRDRIWRGEDSSGRGCRKIRRLCGTRREVGDLVVIAPVTVIP